MKRKTVFEQNSVRLLHEITVTVVTSELFKMKESYLILIPIVFGVIAGDYVEPQNGFANGNGNGNGNAYGVPTGPIAPTQPQGGPYPPSGWKPAGRRLLLPGESRDAQQPIDSGIGQPPPPQYGPANPAPSGPSIDSQYGPSVDNTAPPNNQYIPGSGFGNGGGNGNGHNGNGHNGNGHNGNGHNGNGHNGNGHNGNGHNGNGHNGNGHNGNGHGNGNGHNGGNGFGATGNGNGHNGGNGFGTTGNGHSNGNGANGNGNGLSNGFSNGNGHNGGNGNGHKGGNGANTYVPAFHGAFPGGVIYPFVQHSVPALLAFRPSSGAGHGSIYPIYQVPITPSQSGTDIIVSSLPSGHEGVPLASAYPSIHSSQGIPDLGPIYSGLQIASVHGAAGSHSALIGSGIGLTGNGIGQYYTFLTNHQSQKPNILGVQNGLTSLQLQYPVGQAAYGHAGVPLGVF